MRAETVIEMLELIDDVLPGKGRTLIMESCLAVWNLDNFSVIQGIDILSNVGRFERGKAARAGWKDILRADGSAYLEHEIGGIPVRVWQRVANTKASKVPKIPAPFPGWDCSDPVWTLENLVYSPDIAMLYECRARLAETLFFDVMQPEQLNEFIRYVR